MKFFFLCLFIVAAAKMYAMQLPDPSAGAGVIERQLQEEYDAIRLPEKKQIPLLEVDIPQHQFSLPGGVAVYVDKLEFRGNTVFSQKALEKAFAPYIHKEMTMREIQHLILAVQEKYVKAGYILAYAYPPPQEIDNGVLIIEIMEGVLGEVTVQGNDHYRTSFIEGYFRPFLHKPVQARSIMRALMLLNENLDLNVGGVFKKGKRTGEVDLIVRVHDAFPAALYGSYSNHGSDTVSRNRFGVQAQVGNIIRQGSVLTVGGIVGFPFDELYYYNARYALPLNYRGTEMALEYLSSDFHVCQMESLGLRGKSRVANVDFLQKLHRSRTLNTDLSLRFIYKNIENFSQGNTTSSDRMRNVELGATVDYSDRYSGRNILKTTLTVGVPGVLGASPAKNKNSSRPDAGSQFFKGNIDLQRIQRLPWYTFLVLSLHGQLSAHALTLAEQIYIGGYGTIRGYQVATGLGDHGYYFNGEFRFPVPGLTTQRSFINKKAWKDVLALLLFVDHGYVRNDGSLSANETPSTVLTSVGWGVRLYGPWKFDVSFDWGFPVRENRIGPNSIVYFKVSMRPF